MILLYIRDHEGLGFSGQKITLKPSSQYHILCVLAVLVRYKQAQKCLPSDQNASNKLLWNFSFFYLADF